MLFLSARNQLYFAVFVLFALCYLLWNCLYTKIINRNKIYIILADRFPTFQKKSEVPVIRGYVLEQHRIGSSFRVSKKTNTDQLLWWFLLLFQFVITCLERNTLRDMCTNQSPIKFREFIPKKPDIKIWLGSIVKNFWKRLYFISISLLVMRLVKQFVKNFYQMGFRVCNRKIRWTPYLEWNMYMVRCYGHLGFTCNYYIWFWYFWMILKLEYVYIVVTVLLRYFTHLLSS